MTVRTIKGVDEHTWSRFKQLAVKKRIPMGTLFARMVQKEPETSDAWDTLLNKGNILSEAEAKYMAKKVESLRKQRGFRQ